MAGLTPSKPLEIIPCGAPKNAGKERALDDRLKTMLKNFERALTAAMAGSTDVGHSLRNIQDAGYSLYLRVDCKRAGDSTEQLTLPARRGPEPTFKINGQDLAMLKALGIDPTRKLRKRRSS